MSHDSMHYVDSVNLYTFAGFDPINSWDPMGLESGGLAGKKLKPVFKPLEEIEEPLDDTNGSQNDDANSAVDDFREGVLDYFMFDEWGLLTKADTWDIAVDGYKQQVKHRIENVPEYFDAHNVSPMINDIEGAIHDGERLGQAIGGGDFRAMGKLALELLLKVLAVALVHKGARNAVEPEALKFDNVMYHGKVKSGGKNPGPTNGQIALDSSIRVKKTSSRRIAVDPQSKEFVVFDETSNGVFHGHVRSWNVLTTDMQNTLRKAGLVNHKAKIVGDGK